MSRFREKFMQFMSGRNGVDEFSRFLSILSLILLIISIFIPWQLPRYILWGLGAGIMVYSYFRIFSRNYNARSKENQWFCSITRRNKGGYSGGYTNEQKKAMDKKTHKIFKCPNCAQKIRVPKHKGKICISCPKCRNEFIKRT